LLWEAAEVRQMAGRAGRTGQCVQGSCVVMAKATKASLNHAKKLLRDDPKASAMLLQPT
jgi:superfamily II RNA helicase